MNWAFIKFFTGILGFLLIAHGLIFTSWVMVFNLNTAKSKLILGLILFLLSICLIVAAGLGRLVSSPVISFFYTFGALWYGLMIHLLFASVLIWAGVAACKIIPACQSMHPVKTGAVILYLAALAFTGYGFYNARNPVITHVTVPFDNLPAHWRGKTIVHLSDLHLGHIYQKGFVEKISRQISGINPEIIVITGDLFDGAVRPEHQWTDILSVLSTGRNVYYVTGNHEIYSGFNHHTEIITNAGITVMDETVKNISGLLLIGVGYPDFYKGKTNDFVIENQPDYDPDAPKIILYHTPTDIADALDTGNTTHARTYIRPTTDFTRLKRLGNVLQLSGHTHQGQIIPFTWLARRIFNGFDHGLNPVDGGHVYTSSGTGTWGPPIRTGGKSEIVVITLVPR